MSQKASSKPILAIDFDDTLVHYASDMAAVYNSQLTSSDQERISPEDTYYVWKFRDPEHGWDRNRQQADAWLMEYLSSSQALAKPPIDGAAETLKSLSKRYRFHVITGRIIAMQHPTEKWLDRHLHGLIDQVHYTIFKADICLRIGAVALIDDAPQYIEHAVEAGIKSVLFGEYPWNRDDLAPAGSVRARTWKEVGGMFDD